MVNKQIFKAPMLFIHASRYIVLCLTLLIGSALQAMQTPQQIANALIDAAYKTDGTAYRKAADAALVYLERHPEAMFQAPLSTAIVYSKPIPHFAGHAIAVGYDALFNSRFHMALSASRALSRAALLWPRHKQLDNVPLMLSGIGCMYGPSLYSVCECIRDIWNMQWSKLALSACNVAVHSIPLIYEIRFMKERNRFLDALHETAQTHAADIQQAHSQSVDPALASLFPDITSLAR